MSTPRDTPPRVVPVDAANDPVVERRDDTPVVVTETPTASEVTERERAEYGGIKFGSAFFGWLAATGLAVLLTALVAALGAAVGLRADDENDTEAIGIVGAIALVVIMFVAYFAGGYVAGRMARFDGARQGLAVWLWAIVIAILVAVVGYFAGERYDILAAVDGFPRIPVDARDLTVAGIATAVIVAIVSLIAAVLGGIAGMRFHRRVDRAGLPG